MVRGVDRCDRGDLVAIAVICEISCFEAAFGMREDVYFVCARDLQYFIKASGNYAGVAFNRAYGILIAEEDLRTHGFQSLGNAAPVA